MHTLKSSLKSLRPRRYRVAARKGAPQRRAEGLLSVYPKKQLLTVRLSQGTQGALLYNNSSDNSLSTHGTC